LNDTQDHNVDSPLFNHMRGIMSLQQVLERLVSEGGAPYLVASVANGREVCFSGAAGNLSSHQAASEKTIFRIFSMTKSVCATAAAILAERGQLDWSWPVGDVLPEFDTLRVLAGFEDGEPRLRMPKSRATLAQLATHTSGLVYDLWDERAAQFLALTGQPSILSGSKASLLSPLAFDPGSRWQYGIGVDWLGQVIEKIDGRTIDRFCVEEIFEPLAMTDTTFFLAPEARSNLGTIFSREPDGTLAAGKINLDPPDAPEFYGMGHALYSTAGDYIRFLRMWLNGGELEGARLLRRDTATDFLSNKLESMDLLRLRSTVPIATHDLDIFPGLKKGHSLGFARIEESLPGARTKGSQFWAGVLNTHFWFDPNRQVAAVLMTQLTPFFDPQFMKSLMEFERAVYAQRRS
jgi:methyl acetate hydrolase